jgi:uncharacterized protein
MELTNQFSVQVPVEEAWAVLTDLERVAPCMPGFELREVEGDEYRGVVRVKVGPIVAQYRGVASFRERDEARRRAVVHAEGRETRGQGTAAATVTATLAAEAGGTRVTLHTDLRISGKVAQLGRGVLAEVSSKLLRQFVEALEADVLTGERDEGQADSPATASPRAFGEPAGEPVDLWATARSSVIKRLGPLVLALIVVLWLLLRR